MARRGQDPGPLEEAVGHRFGDRKLLDRALTHISALHGTPADGPHYQRLEFLGDRVLGVVVADMLYRAYPRESEGGLSRRLGHLVRRETCAEVALAWGVGPYLRMGTGEAQAGLRKKEAILGDVCEAIIAAVWLDAGWDAARTVVERAFGPKMTEPGRSRRDAKSTLQEWALARGLAVPDYVLAERAGPDHAPRFRVAATIAGYEPCEGEGLSKRMAEQAAAQAFLVREGLIEEERT